MAKRMSVAVAIVLLGLAKPAWAHVRLTPAEAARGAVVDLTFRVPNERDGSGTVKVELFLPSDHPLAVVEAKPTEGWTASTEKATLSTPADDGRGGSVSEVVTKVIWTGGPMAPEGAEEFVISAGPMPGDADRLFFKSLQTYASGEVVRWIDEVATGDDRPSPVLRLTGAVPVTTGTTTSTSTTTTTSTVPSTTTSGGATEESSERTEAEGQPSEDSGGGAPWILGGVAAVALLGGGLLGLRRRRSAG